MRIPLTGSSVKPAGAELVPVSSASTGGMPYRDPSAEVAKWNAVAGAGKAITDVSLSIQNKMTDMKEKSDLANYEVSVRSLNNQLSNARAEALESGMSYEQVLEDVYEPAIKEFGDSIEKRGYLKSTAAMAQQRFAGDSEMIRSTEINARNRMRIAEHVAAQDTLMNSYLVEGNKQGAKNTRDNIAAVIGKGKAQEMYSGAQYKLYNSSAANLSELLANGTMSPTQYIDGMKNIRENVKESDMNLDHKETINSSMTYQIANATARSAKEIKKFESTLTKAVVDGNLTPEWVEIAESRYGEEIAGNMKTVLENSLNKVSATDNAVKKTMHKLDGLTTSPMRYGDIVEYAAMNAGEYGEEVRELAAIIAGEYIESGATIAYDKMVSYQPYILIPPKKVAAPYTGWVADVHKEIVQTMDAVPSDKNFSAKYQSMCRELITFYNENPNPDQKERDDFTIKMFRKPSTEIIQSMNSPQLKQTDGAIDFDKMTDEELEAYINE